MGTILKQKTWVLFVTAVPKPRMTQRDRWAKRPCVQRYWKFKSDLLREFEGQPYPKDPHIVSWEVHIVPPKSWSRKRKDSLYGRLHRQKPDKDNYEKGLFDALFKEDSRIAGGSGYKYWARVPSVVITMTWEEEEE